VHAGSRLGRKGPLPRSGNQSKTKPDLWYADLAGQQPLVSDDKPVTLDKQSLLGSIEAQTVGKSEVDGRRGAADRSKVWQFQELAKPATDRPCAGTWSKQQNSRRQPPPNRANTRHGAAAGVAQLTAWPNHAQPSHQSQLRSSRQRNQRKFVGSGAGAQRH